MDQEPTNNDLELVLAELLERLENADPADAPEWAAQVADELQRRLRG